MEVVTDRVALISCATDEVGAAIGMRLAENGAKVIISGTDQGKVASLVSMIKAKGGSALGLTVNGTQPGEVKTAVAKILADFGKVDILINNADSRKLSKIQDVSDAQWQESLTANLSPVFLFCRELIPAMCAQQHGRIVNISSIDYIGLPGMSNYSAAKSALFGFTRSLALEVARDNVTVNCVAKGDIRTSDMSDEDVEKLASRLPVKKLGTPEDAARAVCFFASDTSKYVTGQTFFVCGGKSAYFSMSI
jgi:3-oxoacyl-[acyl-carrier protein] reductase/2-[hydroxy(phenyl)methyl]-succinyl-CoA dehydrogenase BbsC subunit